MSHDSAFTTGLHLRGDVAPDVRWYPDGIQSQPKPYASVSFDGLTVFVNEPGQAQPLADAFADVAAHFGAEPVRAYVMRQARETIAEFRAWLAEPVTGTGEDGPPRQYRYAEFAGRMATLLDELTDSYVPPARNTHPGLTRNGAELALPAALHVPPADVAAFLDNTAEQGRWDNSYGYATYDPARGLFTIYAYEAV